VRLLGKKTIKIFGLVGFITFFIVNAMALAAEGDFPNRPVNLIVGFDPGASASISAHIFADGVQKQLVKPQPFIINHKPGASGLLGADYFMKQPPDGYTLLWPAEGSFLRMAFEPQKFSFTLRDFAFLGGLTFSPYTLAVSNESPFKTFEEFADYAKKNPGVMTFSTTGIGSGNHIAAEVVMSEAGIKLTHVPFRSGNAATLAMLGGHVSCIIQSIGTLNTHVKGGKARVLLVFDDRRSPELPNVPTAKEKGYNVLFSTWYGLIARKETPRPVLDTLAKLFRQTAGDPAVQSALIRAGMVPMNLSPEDHEKRATFEYERASEIFGKLGLLVK
jgi:tripartite-type tricarboxylate transporter receptor subunit TctC